MVEPRKFVLVFAAVAAATVMGAVDQTAASFFPSYLSQLPRETPFDRLLIDGRLVDELARAEAAGGWTVRNGFDHFEEIGQASWYGNQHQGKTTASGAKFDMNKMTAAHRTLPLGSNVRVTNLENGRSVEVVINDRGPYVGTRVIDLSREAARRLEMERDGIAPVRVEQLSGAPGRRTMN
jgi:rare lipoprotein A (peptidoglycan hydrolase)